MKKSRIAKLLGNMCCSNCKHDFDEESVSILKEENHLFVLEISCSNCGKNFGIALLNTDEKTKKNTEQPLEFIDCPVPINYDEILDAHNFIENLEKDWSKYIPDNLK